MRLELITDTKKRTNYDTEHGHEPRRERRNLAGRAREGPSILEEERLRIIEQNYVCTWVR